MGDCRPGSFKVCEELGIESLPFSPQNILKYAEGQESDNNNGHKFGKGDQKCNGIRINHKVNHAGDEND
jgi:hypothetical protein